MDDVPHAGNVAVRAQQLSCGLELLLFPLYTHQRGDHDHAPQDDRRRETPRHSRSEEERSEANENLRIRRPSGSDAKTAGATDERTSAKAKPEQEIRDSARSFSNHDWGCVVTERRSPFSA